MSPVSRRNLLGRAAVTLPALALPVAASAAPVVDPHLDWWDEYNALADAYNDGEGEDEGEEYEALTELEGWIADTEAETLAGVLVQLRLVDQDRGSEYNLSAAVVNAIATLEKLTGEAA